METQLGRLARAELTTSSSTARSILPERLFHRVKPRRTILGCAAVLLFLAGILPALAQPSNIAAIKRSPTPNYSQASQSLPDGSLAWDAVTKTDDAISGQDFARFSFSFTNVSAAAVTILSVHPSCGCTTAELPPVPWTIPAGSTGQIKISVNLAGKSGTLFKSVNVATDKGGKI